MAAADSAMPGGPGKEMDISKVNPQQLQQLHQSLEQEIQNLNVSFQTLQTVNAKFKVNFLNAFFDVSFYFRNTAPCIILRVSKNSGAIDI